MLGNTHDTSAINEKSIAQVNPLRVGFRDTAAFLTEALGERGDGKIISPTKPHQVGPERVAQFLTKALGVELLLDEKLTAQVNPHRVNSERAAELLADALGVASINEEWISQLDPHRVQLDPIKNPAPRAAPPRRSPFREASTRVRFTTNARSTTKAQSREILRRDCWCCSTPGCCNRIWLHIHHLESFSKGGRTEPRNLIGLCSACHKNTHDGLLKIERQPDGRLLFFDQFGNRLDRQVDLHIAEWLDYEIGWTGGKHNSYKARCGVDWSVVSA